MQIILPESKSSASPIQVRCADSPRWGVYNIQCEIIPFGKLAPMEEAILKRSASTTIVVIGVVAISRTEHTLVYQYSAV
jgi:hypothetical protein